MTTSPESASTARCLAQLRRRRTQSQELAAAADTRQAARGKAGARSRIEALLDPGSFVEIDALATHRCHQFGLESKVIPGDGVVTGYGTIEGRNICIWSQDFSVFGGSLGEVHGQKITKIMDLAVRTGTPCIGISDGGGARIQEGVASLTQFAEIFRRNVAASGVIPQISLIMGPSAGGAVYSPALTDFVVMVDNTSHMFITGPEVIRAVTGEDVGFDELGGATPHTSRSGVAHFRAHDENDAFDVVRDLLAHLPSNNLSDPPTWPSAVSPEITAEDTELNTIIPDSDTAPYDMRKVVATVVDDGELLLVQEEFAPNILCAFGHIEGKSVGIVANQPSQLAGSLDIAAAEKAARFVRTCDVFNLPVVTFVDVPGFLPGTDQEWNGIIRRGAKLIYAYADATVPLVTIITRKAYGGAYIVMGSKLLGADFNFAWPTAQIAVMGADGAVNIVQRRTLAKVAQDSGEAAAATERDRLVGKYREALINPWEAAARGFIDSVIEPAETRLAVISALRTLRTKRVARPDRKHGNIPL